MFLRKEERRDVKGLSDLIDHFALVDDGIVLCKTGVLVAGWEFRGKDMEALPVGDCWHIANRIAQKLQLGSGWTIQCDLIRAEHPEYCDDTADWPDPVSYLIEQERHIRFTMSGEAGTRLSRYFLALSYEPLAHGKRAAQWMFSAEDGKDAPAEKTLAFFRKRLEEVETLLLGTLDSVRRLKSHSLESGQLCDEFLSYVRRCICSEDYPFAIPEVPAYLDQYLASDDLTGGAEPEWGDPLNEILPGKSIRVLAIDGFPDKSFAGILRELDSVPYDFRFCQQAELLDEQEAKEAHEANRGHWGGKKEPMKRKLSPIKVAGPAVTDNYAAQMEADANWAASLAAHGKEISVRFSAKVIAMETDRERLKQALDAIARVIKYRCGFSCRLETVNAVAAWRSSIPGQYHAETRRFLVTTQNLAHMLPLSAPFRGHDYNPSPYFPAKSQPLFYAVTSGGTPYRFHPHVSDVGHELITGPSGSGKTTWLALGIAQFFRYPNAQVFAFDKKRTLYTLCKAMGGDFYEISPNGRTYLCPLQELETPGERELAAQWIELLLAQNDLKVTGAMRNDVAEAISLLAGSRGGRSLTDFQMAVGSREVKEALQFYLGGILDGDEDSLSLSRFCVFEMDELYRLDKKTMNGALFYLFARIRRRLTSDIPTLVSVDEFREALTHDLAAKYFNEFLLEGRKLNMAVWLVLQELSKVLESPLRTVVLEQCFTKVCLPNPQAIADGADAYETLGLTVRDRELIAHAEPKQHYYVTSPDGKRMVSLELGQVALSFLAASTDRDRALVDSMAARNPGNWQADWLRSRGLDDWAELYESVSAGKEIAAYA